MTFGLFKDVGKEIALAKKSKGLQRPLQVLIFDWALIAFSVFLAARIVARFIGLPLLQPFTAFIPIQATLAASIATLISGIVFSLFLAYPLQLLMRALGGKGRYKEALTVISYALFPLAVGILIASLLTFIPPPIGSLLAFVALAFTLPISLATLVRSLKDLWNVDWLVALIGAAIFSIAITSAGSVLIGALPTFP